MRTRQNTQLVITLEPREVLDLLDYFNQSEAAPHTQALKELYAIAQDFVNPRVGG